ncbi:MAG: adenosylcobinamide-phosphate synthase CbiB [Terriglobales bacterium]
MTAFALCTACGYLADLCLGEPLARWHPVRGIGWLITHLEPVLRGDRARRLGGVVLLLVTVGVTCAAVLGLLWLAGLLGRWARWVVSAALIGIALATRDLVRHGMAVQRPLLAGDLIGARAALARIVSRDTASLNATAVGRGAVESLAENLVDGSIAPLLFALLGGPVAIFAFKAVSTLDSMVGYRNERYSEYGWAAARCDDVLNYLPARTLFLTLPLSSLLLGENAGGCARLMWRDGGRNPSPNSGIPEAGFAGALGVELGGLNLYAGQPVEKPRLNAGGAAVQRTDIARAGRLVYVASFVTLLAGLALVSLAARYWRPA